MMQTCRTCRHFSSDDFLSENVCALISRNPRAGTDAAPHIASDDLSVVLVVAPDFGCVLHSKIVNESEA